MSEGDLLKTIERARIIKDFCEEYNSGPSLWGQIDPEGRVKDLVLLQWILDNQSLIKTAQELAK